MMIKHFGVDVILRKHGYKLNRENYAEVSNKNSLPKFSVDIYADIEGKIYTEEWCRQQYKDVLANFDLNMEYFSLLDHVKFENALASFLRKNKRFKEVTDLNLLYGQTGYYLMVLDEYCQVYIGTSNNMFKRIRNHWNARKSFDRLLFPMGAIDSSIMSIDSFRALDTTRLYASITEDIYENEDLYINQIPSEFCCNRMSGGLITGLQVMVSMKSRKLK